MRNFKIGAGESAQRFNGDDESAAIVWNGVESYSITAGGLRLRNVATASLPADPPDGTMVYDTTTQTIKTWNGASWTEAGAGLPVYAGTTTWTPHIWDASLSSSEGQTYAAQVGHVARIGSIVFISGSITPTSKGTLTTSSSLRIGPLPYTSAAINAGVAIPNFGGISLTAPSTVLQGIVQASSNYFTVYANDSATDIRPVLISEFSDTGYIAFNGFYFV